MKVINTVALLVATAAVQGCATSHKVQVVSTRGALPENCPVTKYSLNAERPADYEVLATLKIGEKGLSVSCTREEAEASMRAEACRVGANAIIIVKEKEPDLWSTCYRATVELVYVEGL